MLQPESDTQHTHSCFSTLCVTQKFPTFEHHMELVLVGTSSTYGTACILYELVCDVALCWVHTFFWSTHFYNIMFVSFAIFSIEMVEVEGQHACIKFCFKISKTAAKTHKMLEQALGDDALGQMQTCNLFNRLNWPNISWQWWMFWFNFNWHNNGKCCKSVWRYL